MRVSATLFLCVLCSVLFGQTPKKNSTISVDTILSGEFSIRAIVPSDSKIWYAADQGRFGFYDLADNTHFEKRIVFDSIKPEFRSIAETSSHVFVLSIGNPALLYKVDKKSLKPKLVYREIHKKAFYDSMDFWNDVDGIAIGDPTEDCFSILLTGDGGNTWNKLPCTSIPKLADGEAAFAASNTNVIASGNNAWIVSGGRKSRVFRSKDKGKNWEAFETPIVQGNQMTGIFTAAFYDDNTGFIAGGDYDNPEANLENKAITSDGGKTWTLVAKNDGFGYASCVQFIPGSNGRELVCVGASGLHYSDNAGQTWQKLLDDKTLYTIKFSDPDTAFAAGRNKIIRIEFTK